MSSVITGATGQLGRHVLTALLKRNVPAEEIVATGRSIEKLADPAACRDAPKVEGPVARQYGPGVGHPRLGRGPRPRRPCSAWAASTSRPVPQLRRRAGRAYPEI
jgi:hypothetical protein